MHIKTISKIDKKQFNIIKEQAKTQSQKISRNLNRPDFYQETIREIGLKITAKCNLRCDYCYLWGKDGTHRKLNKNEQSNELKVSIIEKILKDTERHNSSLVIMGGEPFVHQSWEEISNILAKYPRRITISTNGLLLTEIYDSILPISSDMILIISLPGFKESIESIRGAGEYERLMENIKFIISLKNKKMFNGIITINCVLNKYVTPRLYEFTSYLERLGIDHLIFSFPYYIKEETAKNMDQYCTTYFPWLNTNNAGWHCYKYHLNLSEGKILKDQMKKISTRKWKIGVRFHPNLELNEIDSFIYGDTRKAKRKQYCLNLLDRLEVFPDGNVSACKIFSEFITGNVYQEGILEIWNGEEFKKIRGIMNKSFNDGSFPLGICSKCHVLSDNQL